MGIHLTRILALAATLIGSVPLRTEDASSPISLPPASAWHLDFADESWGPRLDGRLIDQFTGPQQPWVPQPDNIRNFFNTGNSWNTDVAIARSGERSNVRLSLSNTQVNSMAPGNKISRIGLALKGNASITERISTEASLHYTNQDADNRVGTGYDEDNPMQSFIWFGRQVDVNRLRDFRCSENKPTPCTDGAEYN